MQEWEGQLPAGLCGGTGLPVAGSGHHQLSAPSWLLRCRVVAEARPARAAAPQRRRARLPPAPPPQQQQQQSASGAERDRGAALAPSTNGSSSSSRAAPVLNGAKAEAKSAAPAAVTVTDVQPAVGGGLGGVAAAWEGVEAKYKIVLGASLSFIICNMASARRRPPRCLAPCVRALGARGRGLWPPACGAPPPRAPAAPPPEQAESLRAEPGVCVCGCRTR